MSFYTSLGVTVSPPYSSAFLEFIGADGFEKPDLVYMDGGSVSAVWQDHNHFDPYSSEQYNWLMDFLKSIGEDNYIYESVSEGCEPEVRGNYCFGFATKTVYEMYGSPVSLGTKSKNRRRTIAGRR